MDLPLNHKEINCFVLFCFFQAREGGCEFPERRQNPVPPAGSTLDEVQAVGAHGRYLPCSPRSSNKGLMLTHIYGILKKKKKNGSEEPRGRTGIKRQM